MIGLVCKEQLPLGLRKKVKEICINNSKVPRGLKTKLLEHRVQARKEERALEIVRAMCKHHPSELNFVVEILMPPKRHHYKIFCRACLSVLGSEIIYECQDDVPRNQGIQG